MYGEATSSEEERIATEVVDAAYQVHMRMGPGLLESVYVRCLAYELVKRGFTVETEVPVPIRYDGVTLEQGFRLDLLVNRLIVVEVKSIEKVTPDGTATGISHQLQCETHQKWNPAHHCYTSSTREGRGLS